MQTAMEMATSGAPLATVLLLLVLAVIAFVGLFKSGKREKQLDEMENVPQAIKDLELTKAANAIKAAADSAVAKIEEAAAKVKSKL